MLLFYIHYCLEQGKNREELHLFPPHLYYYYFYHIITHSDGGNDIHWKQQCQTVLFSKRPSSVQRGCFPDSSKVCRGGWGPSDVSRWSPGHAESDHNALSDPSLGETGASHHKLSVYHQQASYTGDTHECEHLSHYDMCFSCWPIVDIV